MIKQAIHSTGRHLVGAASIIRHALQRYESRRNIGRFGLGVIAVVLVGQLVVVAYHQGGLHQRDDVLARVDVALHSHADSLEQLRREEQTHTNALAQQVARLQAHITRLNALGMVLSDLAQVSSDTAFDFNSEPGLGGRIPTASAEVSEQELAASVATLHHQVEDSQLRLEILRELLHHRHVTQAMRPSSWPVQGGWVSSYYGMRKDPFHGGRAFHHGVDIASTHRARIYAAAPGQVEYVGRRSGYGIMVELSHGDGYRTRYAHASKILVKPGQFVERGQEIALVGSTGRSTGDHLHFEVLQNGKAVNPLNFLAARR